MFLNWYSNPPYVEDLPSKQMTGIMADLVKSMIKSSCGKCQNEESKIHGYQSLSGENPVKKNELEVKGSIGKEFHVSFPVFGYSSITRYMEYHVFILFIESLGSATIVRNEVDYAKKTITAFKSILNIWPMYLITFLITGVFGIFIWHCVSAFSLKTFNYIFGLDQTLIKVYFSPVRKKAPPPILTPAII